MHTKILPRVLPDHLSNKSERIIYNKTLNILRVIISLKINLMSLLKTPHTGIYTEYQLSTELENLCGAKAKCGIGS